MLTCQKHQFSLPDGLHYLNCAYMAPLSKRVEAAGIAGMQCKRVPSTIGAEDFFEDSDTARRLFAGLINADPSRIALIPAASYGIATVAHNLDVRRGQNLVVMHEQFPSNIYSWHRLVEATGAEIRVVHPPNDFPRGSRWNERILEAIDSHTALVAMAPVHWTDGTLFDLERIGARAREVNAVFVVDGTQSVGALPFDVETVQPDALICAGYKWLLGPYCIGAAYYGPRFDGGIPLEENWITRRNSEQFSRLVQYEAAYQPGAIRYDVGERSNFILVPMLIAGLEHLHEWGPDAIQTYCANLICDLTKDAQKLGFTLEDEAHRSAHLFGVHLPPHAEMERLQAILSEGNISVSLRGESIRISPHVYNDAADIDAMREALRASVQSTPAMTP